MTNPQTTPIPVVDNQSPIYDQLVAELGDPYIESEDLELASQYHAEARSALTQLVQDSYLAQIEARQREPETTEIAVQAPARKHKVKGR